jgi:hypothetical protein
MILHYTLVRAALVSILVAVPVHAATVITIDQGPMAGHPSVAMGADGLPVIAYQTLGNKLILAKCGNWDCSDNQRIELSGNYFAQTHFSLAITPAGNPAVAYRDSSLQDLMWVKCVTADCTGGGHVFRTIHASADSVGSHVDFAYGPDNRPAFVYQNATHGDLMLARCAGTACNSVTIDIVVPGVGATYGEYNSIAFRAQGDDPLIGSRWFNTFGDSSVAFHDCSIEPCGDSVELIFYQISHPVGLGSSMALGLDDRPVFSYIDQTDNGLRFARCQDADCSGSRDLSVLDDGDLTLGFDDNTSIGVRPDGRPVIAYQKSLAIIGGLTALYVAECADTQCATVEQVQIERSGAGLTTGIDADLAIDDDGGVVIAWFDQSALSIKLARCSAQGCDGPGDRIFSDGFE